MSSIFLLAILSSPLASSFIPIPIWCMVMLLQRLVRSAIALQTWLPNSHILHDEILKLLALLPTGILDRANLLFFFKVVVWLVGDSQDRYAGDKCAYGIVAFVTWFIIQDGEVKRILQSLSVENCICILHYIGTPHVALLGWSQPYSDSSTSPLLQMRWGWRGMFSNIQSSIFVNIDIWKCLVFFSESRFDI